MAGLDPDLSSYAGYGGTNKLLATPTNSPESLNGWLSAARQGVALNAQQFDLAKQHLSALNDLVSSVMADPSQENATARIADGVRMGVIPHEEGTKELSDLAALGGDPNRIRQWAFQHGQVIGTLAERMQSAYGTPGLVNNGQQQMPMVTRSGPQGGVYPAGGTPVQMQTTPEFNASPTDLKTANGIVVQTNMAGRNAAIAGAGGGVAGPSPLLETGLKTYNDDLATASSKMEGVRTLTQALPLIQQLGPTGSGPTSEAFNKAKSALVTLGVLDPKTDNVTAYDEARKYLSNYVSRSSLAGRSDMGLLQTEASSPNLQTSNAATLALAQNAIAADRMDATRPKAFKTGDYSGYGAYRAGYTQAQDLRAYKIDLMPQADRTALLKDMAAKRGTPEGKRFWQSLQSAHDAGVLTGMPSSGQ